MPGRDQAGHEGGSTEKANGVQRKRGDTPRGCGVEIPATGAQPAATGAKFLPGWASCSAAEGQCAAGAGRPTHQQH